MIDLKTVRITPMLVLKAVGVFILGLIALWAILIFVVSPIRSMFYGGGFVSNDYKLGGVPMMEMAYDESFGEATFSSGSAGLSVRNIAPMPPQPSGTVGMNAEAFEVKEYYVDIETRTLEQTCSAISDLKPLDYVVFESANESDRRCNYRFKVSNDNVDQVLAIIEGLDPKELNENVHTIQALIEDFTSRKDILENKKKSYNETLDNATKAYDEISRLATQAQDTDVLAKVINSKLDAIERLTNDIININAQLEQLERDKAIQLDRLEFTYFSVNIFERKFVDFENIKDSWKNAIRNMVDDINGVFQAVTIQLLAVLFLILQYVVYLMILIVVAKYVWRFAKYIWKK